MRLRRANRFSRILGLLAAAAFVRADAGAPVSTPVTAPAPAAVAKPSVPNVIVIDPGHGGRDLGAVKKGVYEKDLTLAVAKRLQAQLEKLGRTVRLTRTDDSYVRLDKRVAEASAEDSELFVSLHLNDHRDKRMSGVKVFAFAVDRSAGPWRPRIKGLPRLPDPPRGAMRAGVRLSELIVRALRAAGLRVNPPDRSDYYVLKSRTAPSVLVELGYLSNADEREKLADPDYQETLAAALARGLTD